MAVPTPGRGWVSPDGCALLQDELDRLLRVHRTDVDPDPDADAWARRRWRERRIRRFQELLLTAGAREAPPDDGVVEAGMVLTVRFGNAPDDETILLADGDVPATTDVEVYSSASPIGSALLGAREGDSRVCRLPDDRTVAVTVHRVRPFRRP